MARVLVVEDEPTVKELVAMRLRAAGHRVVAAATAAEAVQVVGDRGVPDVAVLDVGLPDTDGYALLEQLRSTADRSFGVIFLSADADERAVTRGRATGATYLTKPFVANALLAAVDRAVAPAPEDAW